LRRKLAVCAAMASCQLAKEGISLRRKLTVCVTLIAREGNEMPKDPTRNIERYKISGSHLNEFEFHQNQGRITEQFEPNATAPGAQPLSKAERIAQITAEAHRKVQKHRKQTAKARPKGSVSAKSASRIAKKRSKPAAKSTQNTASKRSQSGRKSTTKRAAKK
jgi:hypothetical protein